MSLSSQFEQEISNYADQLSNYKDQVNEYKNQLIEAKGQSTEFYKSIATEVGAPIATELLRAGATKVLGSEAGDLVGKLAGTGLKQALGQNQGSLADNLADTARKAMSGEAPAEAEEGTDSALSMAKDGIMNVINKVRGGAEDAVAGAEDAVEGAQSGLTSAFENIAQSVTEGASNAVSDLIGSQVNRLSSLAGENDIVSSLKSAYSSITSGEDTSVFGDVELTNMASAVPRAGIADLSLPFESTFAAPLAKFSLDAVPEAFSGVSDLASNLAGGALESVGKFASSFTEPLAQSGLSSNIIARAFMGGRPGDASIEIPDSVIPSQEEALSMLSQQVRPMITSDLLPQGAGSIEGAIGGVVDRASGAVEGLATEASSALEGLASSATEAVSGAISSVSSVAKGVSSIVGDVEKAGEAIGEGVAEGAETGNPAGLIIGGLIGVGTFLYDMFRHKDQAPLIPPPMMSSISVPSFQPGLATSD